MSFAFSQIDPETTGQVTQMPVPVGDYMTGMFHQGQHDSALNSLMEMREYSLANGDDKSPILPMDQANAQYGIKGHLEFSEPTRESVAQLMNRRKRDDMDRQFLIENGGSKMRLLPGMAASFIGGVSNPLDLSLMFVPIVGEERAAARLATAGVGTVRQSLARGLIPIEKLTESGMPLPKFAASVIQGMGGQAIFEVPTMLNRWQQGEPYDAKTFATDVIAGGAFAGALHAGLSAAARLLQGLRPETLSAIEKQAMNDFLNNRETDLSRYVNVDENMIMQRVLMERDPILRKQAEGSVDMDKLKQAVFDKYHESVEGPAFLKEDGSMLKGPTGGAHFMVNIPEDTKLLDPAGGFYTNKGRYVSRDEAGALMGIGPDVMSEEIFGTEDRSDFEVQAELRANLDSIHQEVIDNGGTEAEAINAVRAYKAESQKSTFFARPEVREMVSRERDKQVQQTLDQLRQEHDPSQRFNDLARQEVQRQIQEGRILPDDEIRKNQHDFVPESSEGIDQQVNDLRDDVKEFASESELKKPESKVEAIKAALDCILSKIL